MSTEKLSPRQQMIGLMYLVLLAMLAMNASKDLLNAFIFLDDGIKVTNENLSNGNETVFQKIQSSAALGSEKAISALNNAKAIQLASNELSSSIDLYKKEIIELGGGIDEETGIPLGKDNQDVGAEYLLVNKKGEELKVKIEAYKKALIGMIDSKDSAIVNSLSQLLSTPEYEDYENNKSSWESGISEHLPLVAVTANLSNIDTYVQNAETQVLNYLYEGIALDTYKVNKILATSTANKSYVLQGEQYDANVFLAAADTTQEPIILIGEYDTALYKSSGKIKFLGKVDSLPVRGGIGNYSIQTKETGNHTWGGIMKVPHPNPKRKGEYLMYPFENSYTVAAPSAVISSEKLNIMYLKLKNELNVSAPGISSDKLRVRATNNCSTREVSPGKYVFKPTRTGRIDIIVEMKQDDGSYKKIASQPWTGKRLPKPVVNLLKSPMEGSFGRNKFRVPGAEKFEAIYSPDFPMNGKITIEKCFVNVSIDGSSYQTPISLPGGHFNPAFKRLVRRLRSGSKVGVEMRIRGEDGLAYTIYGKANIR